MKEFKDKATAIFTSHPDETVLFFTSDGFGFFREADAAAHAATLKPGERKVVKVQRFEVSGGVSASDPGSAGEVNAGGDTAESSGSAAGKGINSGSPGTKLAKK